MKRKISVLLIMCLLVLAVAPTLSSCKSEGDVTTLYVYNWGEYISDGSDQTMDVNLEFEKYCKETLGLNVKVNYSTFSSNESMYSKISSGSAAYDVIIPSDYMIQRMVAEDLLFDHSPAELLVLNAKERARAKQLTVGEEIAAMESDTEAVESTEQAENESAAEVEDNFETVYSSGLTKKVARKLPKFMLRDNPSGKEGYVYENFRIFLKWTLDFIASNATLVNLGEIDTVYVNMPQENAFLYDMINADEEEHKVKFLPLLDSDEQEAIVRNLELFGGFYVKQYNKINNF